MNANLGGAAGSNPAETRVLNGRACAPAYDPRTGGRTDLPDVEPEHPYPNQPPYCPDCKAVAHGVPYKGINHKQSCSQVKG